MPFYHTLGHIARKRHTQFRATDGSLYHEEVMGTRGFSGVQSILYHLNAPTALRSSRLVSTETITLPPPQQLEAHLLASSNFQTSGDPITARDWLLVNNDVKLGVATPTEPMKYFYRNASADELLFMHEGNGRVRSVFGTLDIRPGDYVVIPVGITYLLELNTPSRILVLESRGRIEAPRRYRNEYGQLLEHSPFCERDIRLPHDLETHSTKGDFEVRVKLEDNLSSIVLNHHPFDVVGWDGFLYPWAFNIEDFEPITGRIHQPPPVHQTFMSDGFVVCSFVPRLFDYHPQAIPVPYNHSNVNSDEVLYYVAGDFMSRNTIKSGCFTHHPAGIPHGPHPGTVDRSLGAIRTDELAVMVDTFAPLRLTSSGLKLVDPSYATSWS